LLDNLEDGLAVLDREGVVLTWNLAAQWGLQAQHVVNRPFFTLPNGGAQRIRDVFERARATGAAADAADVSTRVRRVRPAAGSAASAPAAQPDRQPQRVRAIMALRDGPPRETP
jgi:PAS fold